MSTSRTPDTEYAGRVITDWIQTHYGSPYGLAKSLPNAPGTSTVYKVQAGQYAPTHKVVRRLEVALGWPSGTVAALAAHDLDELRETDAPTELLRLAHRIAGTDMGTSRNRARG